MRVKPYSRQYLGDSKLANGHIRTGTNYKLEWNTPLKASIVHKTYGRTIGWYCLSAVPNCGQFSDFPDSLTGPLMRKVSIQAATGETVIAYHELIRWKRVVPVDVMLGIASIVDKEISRRLSETLTEQGSARGINLPAIVGPDAAMSMYTSDNAWFNPVEHTVTVSDLLTNLLHTVADGVARQLMVDIEKANISYVERQGVVNDCMNAVRKPFLALEPGTISRLGIVD